MLSLIVIASLVLPSVLGDVCCFPDRVSAVAYKAGDMNSYDFLVDFKMGRYSLKPSGGNVQWVLGNMNNGNDYVMFKDGKCRFGPATFPIRKCIPDDATELPSAIFAGKKVQAHSITRDGRRMTVVTTPSCHPILVVRTIGDEVSTYVYTNVTTSVSDVSSLSMDTDNCVEGDIMP